MKGGASSGKLVDVQCTRRRIAFWASVGYGRSAADDTFDSVAALDFKRDVIGKGSGRLLKALVERGHGS
jgi:hypothetical protein